MTSGTIMEQKVNLFPVAEKGVVNVSWQVHINDDDRMLIGYYIYFKKTNTTTDKMAGRDACNE